MCVWVFGCVGLGQGGDHALELGLDLLADPGNDVPDVVGEVAVDHLDHAPPAGRSRFDFDDWHYLVSAKLISVI